MITVFGSIGLDLIGTVPRLPGPGETVLGGTFATAPGNKGANQALAAKRAGSTVRHYGAIGRDAYGEAAIVLLKADGVDLSDLHRVDADIVEHGIELRGDERRIGRVDCGNAARVLRGERRDDARAVGAERGERLQVGLDAGAAARIGTGDGEDVGYR